MDIPEQLASIPGVVDTIRAYVETSREAGYTSLRFNTVRLERRVQTTEIRIIR
jgi:hypothetical protein